MILVIGGESQGKREFVEETLLQGIHKARWIDESYESIEDLKKGSVLNHFHLIMKRLLEEKKSVDEIEQIVLNVVKENPDLIIITNEIGYGIVPVEQNLRQYRELTGRICCKLAKQAVEVYRVICGIPEKLK